MLMIEESHLASAAGLLHWWCGSALTHQLGGSAAPIFESKAVSHDGAVLDLFRQHSVFGRTVLPGFGRSVFEVTPMDHGVDAR
eukprot:5339630-Amphidinium_carterae.1